jgi:hypothetical protein
MRDLSDEKPQAVWLLYYCNKDDIKPGEDAFLVEFNKVKPNRTKYNDLKKQYPIN